MWEFLPDQGLSDPAQRAFNTVFTLKTAPVISTKSSPSHENWNSLIGSVSEFERDPRQLNLDSLKWTDGSQWSRSAYRLLVGVVRHHTLLLHLLNRFASRPPKATLRGFLLLGIYQLYDAREDAARLPKVVHHTVDLIRKNCSEREGKFANAVLRKIAGSLAQLLQELESDRKWDVLYSHPRWLIERWMGLYGEADTLSLLQWNQRIPQLYAHDFKGVFMQPDGTQLCESLGLHPTSWPDFYEIAKGGREGINRLLEQPLYIQDPSTAIAPSLLGDDLDGNILDACAAPGGKTLLLAKRLGSQNATIYAVDRDDSRIRLIEDNLKRLELTRVKTGVHDWETAQETTGLPEVFDYALVDAPCSSTGIIQKHPEIRWRLKPVDFETLPGQQLRILKAVSKVVKPGGKLVYSTCSIDPAENTAVIRAFLETETGANYRLIQELISLPPQSRHDGVGAALLERIA